uniref:Uncharacterized protein n=1 Tax=Pristionchus pacificus TaxID=54126 RepID=A0A2A6C6Y3_PRIPA|eukprot:PDM73813.1 hypothetical protein PRIPAC_41169 [Pristionchus pacificus]
MTPSSSKAMLPMRNCHMRENTRPKDTASGTSTKIIRRLRMEYTRYHNMDRRLFISQILSTDHGVIDLTGPRMGATLFASPEISMNVMAAWINF